MPEANATASTVRPRRSAASIAVDPWAPDYGAPVDDAALEPSTVPTNLHIEVPEAAWTPIRPPAATAVPELVHLVDGVRRVDARLWVTTADGGVQQGLCASYAAGVVRCNSAAKVVAAEVRRVLICGGLGESDLADLAQITTRHGRYRLLPVAGDEPELDLSLRLQEAMGKLEVAVAQAALPPDQPSIVLVDGPLRQHSQLPGAVGYIKTQHRSYGGPVVMHTVARLAAGERTPVFLVGERGFTRYSWYVRLAPGNAHPLASVVRCEAPSELTGLRAVELANQVTALLPRFASRPHKDPRAPQNLYPIAGLERQLRHRLGDAALVYRALRQAADHH